MWTRFLSDIPLPAAPMYSIRLGVSDVRTGAVTWIDLGGDQDIYLARVDWLPDGKTLAIQRESRDQRRLDLLFADIGTGASRIVLRAKPATAGSSSTMSSRFSGNRGVRMGVGA